LGEHGETTHGAFAYNATLQVPLIFWAAPHLEPQVVSEPVSHVDMVPTILELLGVTVPESVQGKTLLPRMRKQGPAGSRPVYFETLHPYLTLNLAPLTGLIDGRYKYIDLPLPELYDLSQDPRETANLYTSENERARQLGNELEKLVGALGAGAGRDIDTVGISSRPRLPPKRFSPLRTIPKKQSSTSKANVPPWRSMHRGIPKKPSRCF
jgi:arylsulfatase A-like enzyme